MLTVTCGVAVHCSVERKEHSVVDKVIVNCLVIYVEVIDYFYLSMVENFSELVLWETNKKNVRVTVLMPYRDHLQTSKGIILGIKIYLINLSYS